MNDVELDQALDRAYTLLVQRRFDAAEAEIRALRALRPEPPEASYLEGLARLKQGFAAESVDPLERALALDPNYADAFHLLGEAYGQLSDRKNQVRCNLRAWELDREADRDAPADLLASDVVMLEGEAEKLLSELPSPIRARLQNVPVILEAHPSRALVLEGFDPRAFGLFEGPPDALAGSLDATASPSRIVIFYDNLTAEFADEAELVHQLRITLLHEMGHYFGLDEEEVARLGLA